MELQIVLFLRRGPHEFCLGWETVPACIGGDGVVLGCGRQKISCPLSPQYRFAVPCLGLTDHADTFCVPVSCARVGGDPLPSGLACRKPPPSGGKNCEQAPSASHRRSVPATLDRDCRRGTPSGPSPDVAGDGLAALVPLGRHGGRFFGASGGARDSERHTVQADTLPDHLAPSSPDVRGHDCGRWGTLRARSRGGRDFRIGDDGGDGPQPPRDASPCQKVSWMRPRISEILSADAENWGADGTVSPFT